jgi:CRISPR-associated protein Csy3
MAKAAKPKDESRENGRLETGMLSFARSLQPSEGLFWGIGHSDAIPPQPIEVREKGVRGQSSEFKTDNPGKSNPQVVEAASVPPGCDGVRLEFTMWVAAFARKPWACGDVDVGAAYEDLVSKYAEKKGFLFLARHYLWNIATARFAWRNRYLADDMRVYVEFDNQKVTFNPMSRALNLEAPASLEELRSAADEPAPVEDLIAWIAHGLSVRNEPRFMRVAWQARMEEGQEVFPSQEYLREEKAKDAPSRVYAKLPRFWNGRMVNQATMHSQKIGAALRHIDVWHGHQDFKAIAVNPYGGVQETGAVLRAETNKGGENSAQSFYALRSKADYLFSAIQDATGAEDLPGDVHFLVANLVRGGVFGQ